MAGKAVSGKQPQSGTMLREQSRGELGLREEEAEVAVASRVLDIGEMMLPLLWSVPRPQWA
jgi:hypothetical protein